MPLAPRIRACPRCARNSSRTWRRCRGAPWWPRRSAPEPPDVRVWRPMIPQEPRHKAAQGLRPAARSGTQRCRHTWLSQGGTPDGVGCAGEETDRMEAHVQRAEAVRQTCLAAALQASDEAGISGLGHEGCWDSAVEALRRLPLRLLVQALLLAVANQDTTNPGVT